MGSAPTPEPSANADPTKAPPTKTVQAAGGCGGCLVLILIVVLLVSQCWRPRLIDHQADELTAAVRLWAASNNPAAWAEFESLPPTSPQRRLIAETLVSEALRQIRATDPAYQNHSDKWMKDVHDRAVRNLLAEPDAKARRNERGLTPVQRIGVERANAWIDRMKHERGSFDSKWEWYCENRRVLEGQIPLIAFSAVCDDTGIRPYSPEQEEAKAAFVDTVLKAADNER